jgi:hypothetical protein
MYGFCHKTTKKLYNDYKMLLEYKHNIFLPLCIQYTKKSALYFNCTKNFWKCDKAVEWHKNDTDSRHKIPQVVCPLSAKVIPIF